MRTSLTCHVGQPEKEHDCTLWTVQTLLTGICRRSTVVEMLMDDVDHEPLSPEESAALARGREQAARGETAPWKQLRDEMERGV